MEIKYDKCDYDTYNDQDWVIISYVEAFCVSLEYFFYILLNFK